ncbi:hypothetical protein PIB30_021906 [Stylosanthes scabra]|uniref:Uncharacterized protein n=1 Tax=Stylosanthes scabra TaxID=79078 RepID=A0ABU6S990_9FABA|nr:hypothetical protein [Stylosanthes scabra]
MLQKSTSQPIQHQPPAPIPNPLPPQSLPNPKGFLNAILDEVRSEDESKDTDNEETEQHLYELLLKTTESKDGRGAGNEELMGFCEEYGSAHEDDETDQEREAEDEWKNEMQSDKEKFYINTISDMRKDEEELLAKCEDQLQPKEKKGKPQVLLARPFLKTGGFEQDYHDDTFMFSAGKTTERFQIVKTGKDHSLQKDGGRMRGKESAHIEIIEAMA